MNVFFKLSKPCLMLLCICFNSFLVKGEPKTLLELNKESAMVYERLDNYKARRLDDWTIDDLNEAFKFCSGELQLVAVDTNLLFAHYLYEVAEYMKYEQGKFRAQMHIARTHMFERDFNLAHAHLIDLEAKFFPEMELLDSNQYYSALKSVLFYKGAYEECFDVLDYWQSILKDQKAIIALEEVRALMELGVLRANGNYKEQIVFLQENEKEENYAQSSIRHKRFLSMIYADAHYRIGNYVEANKSVEQFELFLKGEQADPVNEIAGYLFLCKYYAFPEVADFEKFEYYRLELDKFDVFLNDADDPMYQEIMLLQTITFDNDFNLGLRLYKKLLSTYFSQGNMHELCRKARDLEHIARVYGFNGIANSIQPVLQKNMPIHMARLRQLSNQLVDQYQLHNKEGYLSQEKVETQLKDNGIGVKWYLIFITGLMLFVLAFYRSKKRRQPLTKINSEKAEKQLTEKEQEVLCKMVNLLSDQQVITDARMTLSRFAKLSNSNVSTVSKLASYHFKESFSKVLNRKRIDLFCEMLNEADIRKFSSDALAYKVGYSSRATFSKWFKSVKGMSFRDYVKTEKEK